MSILVKKLNNVYKTSSFEKTGTKHQFFKKILKLNIILLIFICLILFFYLIQINQIIALGLKIDELEKNRDNLQKTNKDLEIEKIKLESLSNAQNQISSLDFIKADNAEYLRPVAGLTLTRK